MRVREDVLEDIQWLDEHGSGASDVAARTGFPTPHAMERWLEREGEAELWQRLKSRDPVGIHDKANRRNGTAQGIDPIAATIAAAQKSKSARLRKKADRVSDLLAEIREALAAEAESERIRTAALADVTRLERELAEAKARLKGKPATPKDEDDGVSAADLREWAKANGVECPAKGRVPQSVREAYEAATAKAAS